QGGRRGTPPTPGRRAATLKGQFDSGLGRLGRKPWAEQAQGPATFTCCWPMLTWPAFWTTTAGAYRRRSGIARSVWGGPRAARRAGPPAPPPGAARASSPAPARPPSSADLDLLLLGHVHLGHQHPQGQPPHNRQGLDGRQVALVGQGNGALVATS